MVRWQLRDGVYYWPKSVPLLSSALALSSSVWSSLSTISMWHSRLGHSSLPIFRKFLRILSICFPKEHLCFFSCNLCHINKATSYLLLHQALVLPLHLRSSFMMFGPPPLPLLMVFTTTLFLLTVTQSIYSFTCFVVNRMVIYPLSPSRTLLKTISPPQLQPFTQIMGANF